MAKAPRAMLLLASCVCLTAPVAAQATVLEVKFSKFAEMVGTEIYGNAGFQQDYSIPTNNKIWAVTDMSVHITGTSVMVAEIDHIEGTPQGSIMFGAPVYLALYMGEFGFQLMGSSLNGSSYMYDHLELLREEMDISAAMHKTQPVLYDGSIPILMSYLIGGVTADSECYSCQASARSAYSSLYADTTLTITYNEIPEPSSGALLGASLLAAAMARRRLRIGQTSRPS